MSDNITITIGLEDAVFLSSALLKLRDHDDYNYTNAKDAIDRIDDELDITLEIFKLEKRLRDLKKTLNIPGAIG
jgi:hypothetical protein